MTAINDDGCPPLPRDIIPIGNILDERVGLNSFASVIGIVNDFRAPFATHGADWKCEITCYDGSVSEDGRSIKLVVFRPELEMPDVGCGDVVLIRSAKIQRYQGGSLSLCTNYMTDINVFECPTMRQRPSTRKVKREVTPTELNYIKLFYSSVDKSRLPETEEFNQLVERSGNIKDKFRLLQDASHGSFIDTIVQLTKDPYDNGDVMTLWVTDYTENDQFYPSGMESGTISDNGHDGDPYGYRGKTAPAEAPDGVVQGKRMLQVTAWDPQSRAIRDCRFRKGSWVKLRNLYIAFDSRGTYLEGYLRQDQRYPNKINVTPLHPQTKDREGTPLQEAIRRKAELFTINKQERSAIEEAAEAGRKRKAAVELAAIAETKKPKSKSQKKRAESRAAKQWTSAVTPPPAVTEESETTSVAGFNPQIKFEGKKFPRTSIKSIMEKKVINITDNGEEGSGSNFTIELPFYNCKRHATVRVVDFYPPNLQYFAQPRKSNYDFESPSDCEDSNAESNTPPDGGGWEWRFMLKLQEATEDAGPPASVWVVLDNPMTERLTDLSAKDLRDDNHTDDLEALREKMFILWGNLEELKREKRATKKSRGSTRRGPKEPPPDSDDETPDIAVDDDNDEVDLNRLRNLPFECCIRQYGIKVDEYDPRKADAGAQKGGKECLACLGRGL